MGGHQHRPHTFRYFCRCSLEIEWSNSANSYVPMGRHNGTPPPSPNRPARGTNYKTVIFWRGFKCTQCDTPVNESDADLYITPEGITAIHKSAMLCAEIRILKANSGQ